MARLDRNANASVLLLVQLQEEIMSHQGSGTVRVPSSTVHHPREGIPQEYLDQFDPLAAAEQVAMAPISASNARDAYTRLLPATDVWMLSQMSELPAHDPQCGRHFHRDSSHIKSRASAARTAKTFTRCKMRR